MGGGIRNKVKRTNFVKHVTVEAVPDTINSNLDAPAVGDDIDKQYQDPSSLPETSTASCKPQDPSSLPETSSNGSIPCFPRLGIVPKVSQSILYERLVERHVNQELLNQIALFFMNTHFGGTNSTYLLRTQTLLITNH